MLVLSCSYACPLRHGFRYLKQAAKARRKEDEVLALDDDEVGARGAGGYGCSKH